MLILQMDVMQTMMSVLLELTIVHITVTTTSVLPVEVFIVAVILVTL